jgi:hypothetical protein
MNLLTTIQTLRDLEGKGSKGPWYQVGPLSDEESSTPGGVGVKLYAHPVSDDEDGELIVDAFESQRDVKDCALIAEMRTALPQLLDALTEAIEALEYYGTADHYEKRITFTGERQEGVLTERGNKAKAFLKKWGS